MYICGDKVTKQLISLRSHIAIDGSRIHPRKLHCFSLVRRGVPGITHDFWTTCNNFLGPPHVFFQSHLWIKASDRWLC